jgi:hypothetical protein
MPSYAPSPCLRGWTCWLPVAQLRAA